jgi:hypothetical protein
MQMSMPKLVFYSCLVFIAVAGILASGDKTLAQGPRVTVTNTPLPVTVTNQPAPAVVSPFQGQCTLLFTNPFINGGCNITITPPAPGKQLVVQAVSVDAIVPLGTTPFTMQIRQTNPTSAVFHNLPLFLQGQNIANGSFAGMQSLTWIFDPTATAVQCNLQLTASVTSGEMLCNVTGYFQ